MSSEEIENILRIQYKFLNSGAAYNEDYYYLVRPLFPCIFPLFIARLERPLMQKTDQWQTADQLVSDPFRVEACRSSSCLTLRGSVRCQLTVCF